MGLGLQSLVAVGSSQVKKAATQMGVRLGYVGFFCLLALSGLGFLLAGAFQFLALRLGTTNASLVVGGVLVVVSSGFLVTFSKTR